jgi:hypothetical protein
MEWTKDAGKPERTEPLCDGKSVAANRRPSCGRKIAPLLCRPRLCEPAGRVHGRRPHLVPLEPSSQPGPGMTAPGDGQYLFTTTPTRSPLASPVTENPASSRPTRKEPGEYSYPAIIQTADGPSSTSPHT